MYGNDGLGLYSFNCAYDDDDTCVCDCCCCCCADDDDDAVTVTDADVPDISRIWLDVSLI
jgi:hypothetical protein